LAALSYVAWRLWKEQDTLSLSYLWLRDPAWLALALGLLPFNLGLEAAKWRCLLRSGGLTCSLTRAMGAVLAGSATGIFTPNRMGDYAGRLLHLPPGHRLWAAVYTFVSRIAQMAITVLLGAVALLALSQWVSPPPWLAASYPWWLGAAASLGLIGAWGFGWPQQIQRILARVPLRHALLDRARAALTNLPAKTLRQVWGISLLRGSVFAAQYAALLLAFGFEAGLPLALALVCVTLLIKSLAPSLALSELGVRESVALAVMGLAGVQASMIVAATFALFLINLILPALIGLLVIGGRRA
jgi:uncharacterized membrane protein YbhN (UPF0104 family)